MSKDESDLMLLQYHNQNAALKYPGDSFQEFKQILVEEGMEYEFPVAFDGSRLFFTNCTRRLSLRNFGKHDVMIGLMFRMHNGLKSMTR
jgi:hypothetical protein